MRSAAGQPRIEKILMTTDAVGGVWTYGVDLAEGLMDRGIEVTLAVVGPPATAEQRGRTRARVIDTGLTLEWMAASPAEILASARQLATLGRRLRPSLVHLNGPAMAIGGDFGAPVVGACHSCLTTWWSAVKAPEAMPRHLVWRGELQANGMRSCDALIAPSAAFAAATAEAHGPRPLVVRNGRRAAAAALAEPSGAIFTAGRLWDEGKNLTVLDRAAQAAGLEIEAAGPLEGPGGERARLDHLRTLGCLSSEQVRARLAKRPIFVSTALYEPFGLSVLEAAQAGCPLVLADIPTFRELWADAAVFCDPRDPFDVAAKLQALKTNLDGMARLGSAAKARAGAYTLDAMVEGTLSAYRHATSATRATTEVAA